MRRTTAPLDDAWTAVRSGTRRTAARMARRVLPDATVRLDHVEPGLKLRVHLRRNLMFWTSGLTRYEPRCVAVLRAAAEAGGIAVDVGANIGFFTTLLAHWVGPSGRVLAVEPDPENLGLLRRNLDENGCENVSVHACAVSDQAGAADFSRDAATGSTGCLGREETVGERAVGRRRVEVVPIRVESLDDLIGDLGATPTLLKIDIEGGEDRAIAGASRTIENARPIVLAELNGDGGRAVAGSLVRSDYRLWDVESGRPVALGEAPFLALALPAEQLETARGRRVRAAVEEASGDGR